VGFCFSALQTASQQGFLLRLLAGYFVQQGRGMCVRKWAKSTVRQLAGSLIFVLVCFATAAVFAPTAEDIGDRKWQTGSGALEEA